MNPEPQSEVRLGPSAAPERERERERGRPARRVARPSAGRRSPRRFSGQLVLSATLGRGETESPGGSCSPESPSRTRGSRFGRLLASSGTRRRAFEFMGAPPLPRRGENLADLDPVWSGCCGGKGGVSWTKAPAAASPPPAENGAERSGLGGDRDDAAGPRSGGTGRPCVKTPGQQTRKGQCGFGGGGNQAHGQRAVGSLLSRHLCRAQG